MRVLVINAGSSSLKHALLDTRTDTVLAGGEERWHPTAAPGHHAAALRAALADSRVQPEAIGHRVVHGGDSFAGPAVIDGAVRAEIEALSALAPLHNRAAIEGIDAAAARFPEVPQVAAFDTAFHRTMPRAATTYAVPRDWSERYGLRRYGFHGLNVEWCSRYARRLHGAAATRRSVICHLGSGSSVTAVLDGRSVDTSMGFTPMEGVPMATRSGSIDPGLMLHLGRAGITVEELDRRLNHEAGLSGISGIPAGDLRAVLSAADAGEQAAAVAFDVLVRGVAAAVGAMATALDGLDCLVFTGGAGEGSDRLRSALGARVGHLGVAIDEERNRAAEPDGDIGVAGAAVCTLVVRAGEEVTIARQTARCLGDG